MQAPPDSPRERSAEPRPLQAVTFDVTHTLVSCPRVHEIYSEVLERHGLVAPVEEVRRYFPIVWQELACRVERGKDRFVSHPEGPRGWWAGFLERLCRYLEQDEPSPFAAAELYHRFAKPEAWEVYVEVVPTLEELRRLGLSLAVVSNWDERLGPLLTRLGLTRLFDAIVFSASLGIEKPDPRIFRYALDLLEVEPEEALHVGDSLKEDVEGALACGMGALHLDRRGGRGDLVDLSALPALVAERAAVQV